MTYAMVGAVTQDLLTYAGRPIVHHDRAEAEWLLPRVRWVRVTPADLSARSPLPPLRLQDHPDLTHITWPLNREDFR